MGAGCDVDDVLQRLPLQEHRPLGQVHRGADVSRDEQELGAARRQLAGYSDGEMLLVRRGRLPVRMTEDRGHRVARLGRDGLGACVAGGDAFGGVAHDAREDGGCREEVEAWVLLLGALVVEDDGAW